MEILDLSRLVRAGLAVTATLVVALLIAGTLVAASIGAVLPSALGSTGGGGASGPLTEAARDIPAAYLPLFRQASAASCGLPWQVLAAIAKIESGFSPTAVGPYLPQFAGTEDEHALGLMQFLPSTYRLFIPQVDAATSQSLGPAGIWDPASAIHAAAFYLCASGADQGDLRRAIYAYNHADWYVDEVLAQATAYGMGGTTAGDTGPDAALGAAAVALARQYLGWPYAWGGASPATSFDCSGLTQWVYGQLGVRLPRTAQQQFDAVTPISEEDLRPGDLVFFAQTYPDPNDWITHVGLYVGDGLMLHAPQEGDVIKETLFGTGYWALHYAGAGRVRR